MLDNTTISTKLASTRNRAAVLMMGLRAESSRPFGCELSALNPENSLLPSYLPIYLQD